MNSVLQAAAPSFAFDMTLLYEATASQRYGTCCKGSHSFTWNPCIYPRMVWTMPLPSQPKLVFILPTREGWECQESCACWIMAAKVEIQQVWKVIWWWLHWFVGEIGTPILYSVSRVSIPSRTAICSTVFAQLSCFTDKLTDARDHWLQ